ncbi:MAG: hypothetical protein ABR530_07500 [Pyrinomonadaceae bacterium]
MKIIQFLCVMAVLLAVFAGAAAAQKKAPKRPAAKKPAANKTTVQPLDIRTAREKVSIQLDNVNRFIDVLGPVAQGIETLDRSAQTNSLTKAAIDRNEANKQKVIVAIRNLRSGLSDLETHFRTKTSLQKYLSSIQGITDLASQSEDAAIAGKFVGSKEPLRDVAQKLTDTLALIPLSR